MDITHFLIPLILIIIAFVFHWIAGLFVLLYFVFDAYGDILEALKAKQKLNENAHSDDSISFDSFIGKTAVVTIPLKPQGTIEIDGKSISAKSYNGFIETDIEVKIVAANMYGVTVEIAP